jgi:hypothetical protein
MFVDPELDLEVLCAQFRRFRSEGWSDELDPDLFEKLESLLAEGAPTRAEVVARLGPPDAEGPVPPNTGLAALAVARLGPGADRRLASLDYAIPPRASASSELTLLFDRAPPHTVRLAYIWDAFEE